MAIPSNLGFTCLTGEGIHSVRRPIPRSMTWGEAELRGGETRPDLAPLALAAQGGAALCTLIGIEGSFSRGLGAQFAVGADGRRAGDMTGGCLDAALARECEAARAAGTRRIVRYGAGSPFIDIRLPCGGGLDVLVDPFPDPAVCAAALSRLESRRPVALVCPLDDGCAGLRLRPWQAGEGSRLIARARVFRRVYHPAPRLLIFGDSPEAAALARLADFHGMEGRRLRPAGGDGATGLFLGRPPDGVDVDPWTAIVLLFHDHEWEAPLLDWALRTPAFYIGAMGGRRTAARRREQLRRQGWSDAEVARVQGPIGLWGPARDAPTLALSVLADLVARLASA